MYHKYRNFVNSSLILSFMRLANTTKSYQTYCLFISVLTTFNPFAAFYSFLIRFYYYFAPNSALFVIHGLRLTSYFYQLCTLYYHKTYSAIQQHTYQAIFDSFVPIELLSIIVALRVLGKIVMVVYCIGSLSRAQK